MLRTAVLSTSSLLPLSKVLEMAYSAHPDTAVDLFLLRDIDIREVAEECATAGIQTDRNLVDMLADNRIVEIVVKWVVRSMQGSPLKLCSVATYLPSISSVDGSEETERALANCVRIACELVKSGAMEVPIVEIVCGTIADRCPCGSCEAVKTRYQQISENDHAELLLVGDRSVKVRMLLDRISAATSMLCGYEKVPWVFALELEPGINYILNDRDALQDIYRVVNSNAIPDVVRSRVGFNLDIAHYVNAGVSVADVMSVRELIVHCHVCENPGMHTRDLPIGAWGLVDGSGSVLDYLRSLDLIGKTRSMNPRPFSARAALELEGCGRISWFQDGLGRLRQRLADLG